MLGLYLIRMNSCLPKVRNAKTGREELNGEFIINMGNKLDNADANMFILRNEPHGYRELIVSYYSLAEIKLKMTSCYN